VGAPQWIVAGILGLRLAGNLFAPLVLKVPREVLREAASDAFVTLCLAGLLWWGGFWGGCP